AVNSQCASNANPGYAQAAKADDSGAQQRRGLKVGKAVGNRINKILVPDGVFRISSGNGVACEFRMVAQIFASGTAVRASAVSLVQPWNTHSRADAMLACSWSEPINYPDDLVTGNDVRSLGRKLAFHDVEIGAAYSARVDPQAYFPLSRI